MIAMKNVLKVDILLYTIIFIAFYLLNRFSPFIADDFFYAFVMQEGFPGNSYFIPIENLSDILKSQAYAYLNYNGRVFVH
jgi:hypothetical protein